MKNNSSQSELSSRSSASWKKDLARKWADADAQDVALGASSWWDARFYAPGMATSDKGERALRAIVNRALALGLHLGEIRMAASGDFASALCHDRPDIYQEAMAHPNFEWRDLASMSSPAARKLWGSQEGSEGIERFASMLMSQGGKNHKDRHWPESALWDLFYWVNARPQDKASAAVGAAIGLEKLFASMRKDAPRPASEKMSYALRVAERIQDPALTKTVAEMNAGSKSRMKIAEAAAEAREERKLAKERSKDAWRDAILVALSADESPLLLALLSAAENQWPGSAKTIGAKGLFSDPSLFELAVNVRAIACCAAMLAHDIPTGLSFAKVRKSSSPAQAAKLFDLAFSDHMRAPAARQGWIPVLEAFERAALREGLLAGVSAADALGLAAPAPHSRQESGRAAQEQAFLLDQAVRMATLAAELEAGSPDRNGPPKALAAKRL